MRGDTEENFFVEGQSRPPHQSDLPYTLQYVVEPDYLRVMQLPLLRGRFLTDADNEHTARVVVVDEDFAERYFHGQDPIGKHVFAVDSVTEEVRPEEIVGLVGHVRQWGLAQDATETMHAQVYESFMQRPDSLMKLMADGQPRLSADFCRSDAGVGVPGGPQEAQPARQRNQLRSNRSRWKPSWRNRSRGSVSP